jgi:iron complex transport system ATP-binding protein
MTSLDVENLTVHLGRTKIIEDISFRASAGRMLAVIGPNGAGKSTLLRAVTGEIGYNGTAMLGGLSIAHARPDQLAAQRGVLQQSSHVSFPLQVAEVVRLGQEASGLSRQERDEQLSTALRKVDLDGYENRAYQTLSGGEQQRVQLARVLCQVWDPVIRDPGSHGPSARWLFLDEPVSSLDIRHQVQIMNVARDYASAGGGVIAIMHDLNLTAHYADEVLVLKGGRVSAHGPIDDVFTEQVLSHAYDHPVRMASVPGNRQYVVPQFAACGSGR